MYCFANFHIFQFNFLTFIVLRKICMVNFAGPMAEPRENSDQGDARDIGAGRGGHDLARGPPRGRHPAQPTDPLQRQSHIREKATKEKIETVHFIIKTTMCVIADLHGLDSGGCEPISSAAHLHGAADQVVQGQKNRRTATPHFRHWRQQLHSHEALWPGSMHCY